MEGLVLEKFERKRWLNSSNITSITFYYFLSQSFVFYKRFWSFIDKNRNKIRNRTSKFLILTSKAISYFAIFSRNSKTSWRCFY